MHAVITGAEIAHDFIDPIQAHFVEALPIVIGFLVLVAAVVFLIRFLMARAAYGSWNDEIDEYNRGERDSVG
jgi:uncharacterized membrane protein AbrB (regulator of aidB expression)